MNTADLFIQCSEAEEARYIFGVPEEESGCLMLSLERSDIESVLTRHEQGAASMADVYGRLTGKTSVRLGTLVPGATNSERGAPIRSALRASL